MRRGAAPTEATLDRPAAGGQAADCRAREPAEIRQLPNHELNDGGRFKPLSFGWLSRKS